MGKISQKHEHLGDQFNSTSLLCKSKGEEKEEGGVGGGVPTQYAVTLVGNWTQAWSTEWPSQNMGNKRVLLKGREGD